MRIINHDTGEILDHCPAGIRAFDDAGTLLTLCCKQWKCDYCRHLLSWEWAATVRYGIALWPMDAYLWTLTVPGEIYSPDFAFKVIDQAWDNLRKRCQRTLPHFHYAAFVELHPHRTGIAHLHIVTLHWSPGRLKDVAHHAGFGFEAEETTISGKQAAYYVTKYTSKQGSEMPKGFRRVRLSQDWPRLPELPAEHQVLPKLPKELLQEYFLRISAVSSVPSSALRSQWLNSDATPA